MSLGEGVGCKVGVVLVGEGLKVGGVARGGVSPRQATAIASSKIRGITPRLCLLNLYTFDLILYIDGLGSDEVPQPFPRFLLR